MGEIVILTVHQLRLMLQNLLNKKLSKITNKNNPDDNNNNGNGHNTADDGATMAIDDESNNEVDMCATSLLLSSLSYSLYEY